MLLVASLLAASQAQYPSFGKQQLQTTPCQPSLAVTVTTGDSSHNGGTAVDDFVFIADEMTEAEMPKPSDPDQAIVALLKGHIDTLRIQADALEAELQRLTQKKGAM